MKMIGLARRSVEKSASLFRKTKTVYVAYFVFFPFSEKNIPSYEIVIGFDFDLEKCFYWFNDRLEI